MRLNIRKRLKAHLQRLMSSLLTFAAHARMRYISDSGVFIGDRGVLFRGIIPSSGIGAEIGVYKGTLSSFIIRNNNPEKLHLIDPWWKYQAHWHWAVGDSSSVRSFASILLVLQKELESGQVEFHVGDSLDVVKAFPNSYLDWAYIDSTHAYDQTLAELKALSGKVKPGGIIAGDDFQRRGVRDAVENFLSSGASFETIFQTDTQFALKRNT